MKLRQSILPALLLALLLSLGSERLAAQGFDWQYSSRLPTGYPVLFVGVLGNAAQSLHTTTMRVSESLPRVLDCGCAFSTARSIDWSAGIVGEYWLPESNIAVYVALLAEQRNAVFQSDSVVFARNPNLYPTNFVSRYTLTTQVWNTSIEAGFRGKFAPLPFFVGAAVQGAYTLVDSARSLRLVEDANGTVKEGLPTNFITFNPVNFSAKAFIGADIPLATSMYASPSLFIAYPFGNLITGSASWTRLSFGLQVAFMLGFLP
ncbi:MAG: hypothetical protein EAZ92_07465 [Candidatus Kapaibacterium sp.]|nr:MAG: hypothetical protein EAZ92_07465 [Candidatus Kapabacteria bacterium]